jgi:subtilisin family serine protease
MADTTRRYTVLRMSGDRSTREVFMGAAALGNAPAFARVAEPSVDVADLDTRDVRDIGRDPTVMALAPVIPLKLVEPRAAGPAAAGPAWGVEAVLAHTSPFDGDGVVVAILDTGIDATHPAFGGVAITEEDFSGSGNGDRQGHGTHCAGTVFGRDVAGTRIGVARGVKKALIGKVLDDQGRGDSDALFRGITWALSGARVISMSLGFDFPGLVKRLVDQGWPVDLATSSALEGYRANLRLFDELMGIVRARSAFDGGAVVVAAAGNESRRDLDPKYEIGASIPAAATGVVAVGALGQTPAGLEVPLFSNTFPEVSAPGVGIVSATRGGGLFTLSGTSMAAPHVAGVAALWWQALLAGSVPATASNVVARLLTTSRTNVIAPGVDVADRGNGCITAPQA